MYTNDFYRYNNIPLINLFILLTIFYLFFIYFFEYKRDGRSQKGIDDINFE